MEQVEKVSTTQLITEQHGDPEVSAIVSRSVSESEVSQNPTRCSHRRGVGCPVPDDCPKDLQTGRLSTADKTPLPGHLGVNKTCQRFLDHFYWLNLRKVVAQYCKSFHTC